jgi:hypothetical protein
MYVPLLFLISSSVPYLSVSHFSHIFLSPFFISAFHPLFSCIYRCLSSSF